MSEVLVLDCSFLLSCFLPGEDEDVLKLNEYELHVPAIFYTECVSVLNNNIRRNRITVQDAHACLKAIRAISISVDHFSSTSEAMPLLFKITTENALTPYDASYLELALRLNATIATKDRALIAACQLKKIETI